MMKSRKSSLGITAVETVIYIGILVIILLALVQSGVSVVKSHRLVKLKQALESSATLSMERILREVRKASSVDISNSILGTSPGKLVLSGKEDNGSSYTTTFDVSGAAIRISKNSEAPGNLTMPNVSAASVVFRRLTNSITDGVRVELSFSATTSDGQVKTMDLFGFAVLRNSY